MRRARLSGGRGSSSRRFVRDRLANAASCAVERLELRMFLSASPVDVTNYHYNLTETGANTSETTLTPANVNTTTFGKVASLPVDGQIYAQPLIKTGVSVPGVGTEDLVFVATENDSVYAFAANGSSTTPVWKQSLLQTGETAIPQSVTGTTDITPVLGITGTPVIDPSTGTLYVVGSFKESDGSYQQRLYALDLGTGASKLGGPVLIGGSVPGTASGGTTVTFNALLENQRPGLTLANGEVYLAFASHGDNGGYHGWVFGYNAASLQQDYIWCDTPNAKQGGIWMSGGGLSVDANGDLYLTTGNGSFDANSAASPNNDYSMALVKLSPQLQVLDYFSPFNEATLSSKDLDYGCSNAIPLSNQTGSAPNEVLTAGKWGGVYLNNSDTGSLGEFNASSNTDLGEASVGGDLHNTISYWNGYVFVGGDDQPLKAFAVGNSTLSTTASSQSAHQYGTTGPDGQGTSPTISSNGTADGIVWALDNTAFNSGPAVLYAYNANNLGQLLWSSNQAAGGRDTCGIAVKFTTPVVANGMVYVGGGSSVTIYGNIPPAPPPPPPPPPPPGAISGFNKFTLNAANGAGVDGSSTVDNNNGAAPTLSTDSNTLTITTAAKNQASSAFYGTPLYFQNFATSFTYQESGSPTPADGFAFLIQDDSRGANALGGGGGDLGYATDANHPATAISPSLAVEFNVYKFSSTSIATNGANTVSVAASNTGSVNLASGDPINIALSYNAPNQTLTETLTDTLTKATFSTTYSNINLSTLLGSRTAYVGFTAGTGGSDALQTLSGFSYFASPAPQVDLTSVFTGYGISLDGQATVQGGYDGGGSALSETFFGASQTIATPAPTQTFFFAPANQPNTITSQGQAVSLPQGQYGNVTLIGSATGGNQANQAVTVNYTNGTSATFTQSFSDWHTPQNYAGESSAISMAYKLSSTGAQVSNGTPYHVYEYSFAVNPALTVQSVTLPNDANVKVLAINVNAAPAVATVSPTSGPTAGGTTVAIGGTGFTGATAVNFGATPASSFTVNNDGSITAVAPAGAAGAVDVTVVTAYGTSLTSAADYYTYTTPPTLTAAPVINGDDPNGLYTATGQSANGQQRSMVEDVVYTFNEPVTITDANHAFTVAVAGPAGGTVPTTLFAQAVAGSNGTQWAVSLTGVAEGTIGSIANGEYSITINPAYVLAAADGTTSMAAGTGRTDKFYRLYGDVFGTENVTALDYNRFKNSLTTYNPMFDNYNTGNITALDYNLFKKDLAINYAGDGFVTSI